MSWLYESSTGRLFGPSGPACVGLGYSGGGLDKNNATHAAGKNNPSMQNVHNVGPCPEGWFTIGAPVNTHTHGPYVLPLTPDADNEMYGRDEFKIHGDSVVDPGWASEGCIILARVLRVLIWESGDRRLQVVAVIPQPIAQAA